MKSSTNFPLSMVITQVLKENLYMCAHTHVCVCVHGTIQSSEEKSIFSFTIWVSRVEFRSLGLKKKKKKAFTF